MKDHQEEPDRLLPAAEVREIFGVSDMSIWRWQADDHMQFPKPLMIRRRRYWRRGDIVAFQQRQANADQPAAS